MTTTARAAGGMLSGLALAVALVLVTPTSAQAADLTQPFSREFVKRGDVDRNQWNIEHVYDVQYRLRWLGFLDHRPDGVFGPRTERAVKQFQRSRGLRVTGSVNAATWKPLIRRTVRGRKVVPRRCKEAGWHACYDRKRHQVNLYRGGRLLNSWLVRGGSASTPTRLGHFRVYWRDIDHRSNQFGGAPMPYSQFFSGGQALHGSRAMMDPFVGHSHGCVNFWVEDARQLWNLTVGKRLRVHVYGAWD
jgi:hypothetical protein